MWSVPVPIVSQSLFAEQSFQGFPIDYSSIFFGGLGSYDDNQNDDQAGQGAARMVVNCATEGVVVKCKGKNVILNPLLRTYNMPASLREQWRKQGNKWGWCTDRQTLLRKYLLGIFSQSAIHIEGNKMNESFHFVMVLVWYGNGMPKYKMSDVIMHALILPTYITHQLYWKIYSAWRF